jgi:hypothetical protein
VPVAGVTLTVRAGGAAQTVGPASVVAATALAGLAGWLLVAVLERAAARPRRIWTITAPAVLAVSITGPLGSGAGTTATLVLILLHLVAAAVLIPGLLRR